MRAKTSEHANIICVVASLKPERHTRFRVDVVSRRDLNDFVLGHGQLHKQERVLYESRRPPRLRTCPRHERDLSLIMSQVTFGEKQIHYWRKANANVFIFAPC